MNKPTLQSSTLRLILLGVVCFVVGFFALKPQWAINVERRAELGVKRAQNEQLQKSLQLVQTFLKSYTDHSTDVKTANLALPVKDMDAGNFVSSLGELAQASGVTLSNLQMNYSSAALDKTVVPNSIQPQPISFTASGSYLQFRDFILRLENHLRLVDINRIVLNEDDSGLIEYQVQLTTYYQQ